MITAIDTNVLLDVLGADPTFGPLSKQALRTCSNEGAIIACDVVWAEVGALFPSSRATQDAMRQLGIEFSPAELETALAAAGFWKVYRSRGGQHERLVADFLVGAHALTQADRLLTRDRGFYRTYFTRLSLVDPSKSR